MNVLVTGASSGFGKATVEHLLQKGHTVLAGLRGGELRLREVFEDKHSLTQPQGGTRARLSAIDLPLDQKSALDSVAPWIEKNWDGKLDALVNNAGFGLFSALEDQDDDQVREQFEINTFAPVFLTRRLLPYLRKSKGKVVNVTSACGFATFPSYGSYCASKYALEAFTEVYAMELKDAGVHFTLVEPGVYRTDFSKRSRKFGRRADDPSSFHLEHNQMLKKFFEAGSLGYGGDPSEVGRKIVALCESSSPPLRIICGSDARALKFLERSLPRSLFTSLVKAGFERSVYRKRP